MYNNFFSITKEENESLQALIVRIKGAMTKMQNLQLKNFNLNKLDKELVCMAMMHYQKAMQALNHQFSYSVL